WAARRWWTTAGSTRSSSSSSTISARPTTPSGRDRAKTRRGRGLKPWEEWKGKVARRSMRSKVRKRAWWLSRRRLARFWKRMRTLSHGVAARAGTPRGSSVVGVGSDAVDTGRPRQGNSLLSEHSRPAAPRGGASVEEAPYGSNEGSSEGFAGVRP